MLLVRERKGRKRTRKSVAMGRRKKRVQRRKKDQRKKTNVYVGRNRKVREKKRWKRVVTRSMRT